MDEVHPQSREEWRAWLAANHTRKQGVWLITWKKASGKQHLSYEDAVEEALCFGWIDSKPAKLDADRSKLWMSPRKAKSGWSRINKQRIQRAIAMGRMTAAGLARIEAAKLDGSWSKLDAVDALEVPPDLAKALAQHQATENFNNFPPSARRGILDWIGNARTVPTREKRIAETARLAAVNERANRWKPRQLAKFNQVG
jgi:uncharacterized protein YdeI (YjbR/CyaY-like superfamily)